MAFFPPPYMNPMMGGMRMPMGGLPLGMGPMGMGLGMPLGPLGMGMPMPMPMVSPIPGVVPGMPGMGLYNSLPGRFGRDMLGRDFAGPGGAGSSWVVFLYFLVFPVSPYLSLSGIHFLPFLSTTASLVLSSSNFNCDISRHCSFVWHVERKGAATAHSANTSTRQPYRPPDPSALPPMPFGLPFIARPGQEGFDAYGRMIPPDLPEGWDGWGRPIVSANPAGPVAPPGPAMGPAAGPGAGVGPGVGGAMAPMEAGASPNTRDELPSTTEPSTSTTESTGRPDQPSCFDRPPAARDSYFRYDAFEAFSLPAAALNRAWELHLPRELVSHDVGTDDWKRFISDLSTEALQSAQHDWVSRRPTVPGRGPRPALSDAVHALLASWAVAFFAPRGIKLYAASGGARVIPRPVEPPHASRRGHDRADEWSDASSTFDGSDDESDEMAREVEARRADAHYPRVERTWRQHERERERRRARKRRGNERVLGGNRAADGEWEVCFVYTTPTLWTPGARPRTYGEPVVRLRR